MRPTGTNVPRYFAPRMDILGDRCLLVAAKGCSKFSVLLRVLCVRFLFSTFSELMKESFNQIERFTFHISRLTGYYPLKLLLFDIDGTLISTGGAGGRCLNRAFEQLYGFDNILEGVSLAGRTDDQILMEAYGRAGIPFSEEELSGFKPVYFDLLADEMGNGSAPKGAMPGIPELLEQLSGQNHVCLALLTGNWEQSGRIKIQYFNLDHYFPFGAFSDDSPERADLVPVAMNRFAAKYGINPAPKDVYVIGDTPADIRCAKPHGVNSVAVAAAFHSMDDLRPHQPDILLEDLSDIKTVMKLLT